MAVDSAPVRDAFERPVQALFHRLDVDRELPSSGTRTLVREPEEVEGAGFCPRPVRALQGLPPEIDETRFLWMKGQPEPCESLGKYLQHLLGIVSMLEAQHGVIGVTDHKHLASEARLHLALEPLVEHEVKVHVGEERTDNLSLPRPRLAHQQASVVDNPYIDPLPYQSEDACIAYPPLDHLHELLSHDGVEVGGDVQLEDTRGRLATYDSIDFVQCVLCTASGTEPVGAVQKVLFIDGREQLGRCLLQNP